MDRLETLEQARAAVCDRPGVYGTPENNFKRIARLWNVHLQNSGIADQPMIEATDVAIMMGLVKMARLQDKPDHADSWVDLAGYAACGAEVSGGTTAPAASEVSDMSDKMTKDVLEPGNRVRLKWHMSGGHAVLSCLGEVGTIKRPSAVDGHYIVDLDIGGGVNAPRACLERI